MTQFAITQSTLNRAGELAVPTIKVGDIGQPQVTVVMPVYNAMPFLPAACESILNQTFTDFEFLILDDASTDRSGEYLDTIKDHRVRVLHCEKQGLVSILNRGLELANCEFVARMDADDISAANRLERQLAVLRSSAQVVACGCQLDIVDRDGIIVGKSEYPTTNAGVCFSLLTDCALPHPGVMYRRDKVVGVGGYDARMIHVEDYELWTRLCDVGTLVNCAETLLQYRVHGNSVSQVNRQLQKASADSVAAAFVRNLGLAASEAEAAELVHLIRKFKSSTEPVSLAEARLICDVAERLFLRLSQKRPSNDGDDSWAVRQQLRWQIIGRARKHSVLSRHFWQWLRLAQRIDPRGMKPMRVASRAVRNVAKKTFAKPSGVM